MKTRIPRLFWKLFGAFWLTAVLIIAASIFASFRITDVSRYELMVDSREADALLREVFDEEGIQGLRKWIQDSSNFMPGQTIYVVDEQGHDILGRQVPIWLRRRIDRAWEFLQGQRSADWRREPAASVGPDRDPGRDSGYDRPYDAEREGAPPDRRSGRAYAAVFSAADGTRWVSMPGPAPAPLFGVLSRGELQWLVLAVAGVISLASFWLLSRSLSGPAREISDAVDRFASGDLSARVANVGNSNDEIGEIALQFNRMAGALETQARSRQELFRNVSHELRAPLTRLQIATELIERKPETSALQLERIHSEIEVLENLTAQVLSLARATRAEAGDETADLREVVARVANNAQVEAEDKGVEIDCRAPATAIHVQGDTMLVVSAVENVVRNAVQATPAGGKVSIDTAVEDHLCTITVVDGGDGVPDSELEKIFEPFYRLDTNRPGSGIGLAITTRVLSQVGGSVRAENTQDGGLRVIIRIPRADAGPDPR